MRTRNWSIRSKIIALVAVPLTALLALWVFATVLTVGPAFNLLSAQTLLDTVTAYAESGSTLEGAARTLFVHPNTVRYRLRRVAEVCGRTPTDPRDLLTLQLALVLGRLEG